MSTVEEEAPVVVGAGGKEEVVAAPEKVGEVMEAAAGEEEMEVAAGEAKEAEGDGEKVDEAKEVDAGEDEEMEVAAGEAKKPEGEQEQGKAKKRRSRKPRSAAPNHPPYFEMIKEAIMAAGDGKAGASAYAIAKRVGELHGDALPGNYRKVLAAQLRGFAAKGRLVRVKASFRLAPAEEKKQAVFKPKSKRATAKKAASKKAAPTHARAKRGAKKAAPPTAKPKPKQPKSIRARKANKATA